MLMVSILCTFKFRMINTSSIIFFVFRNILIVSRTLWIMNDYPIDDQDTLSSKCLRNKTYCMICPTLSSGFLYHCLICHKCHKCQLTLEIWSLVFGILESVIHVQYASRFRSLWSWWALWDDQQGFICVHATASIPKISLERKFHEFLKW